MEFDSVVAKRSSVRSFKKKKVSFKLVLEAIDAALQGPFAGNMNHMRYLVVENKEAIQKVAEAANQVWIAQAEVIVIACSNDQHLEAMYGERGRVYSRQQAGAAIENFLLKITDMGLASCWVGAFADETVKQLLGIPSNLQIEAVLPIGYSNEKPAKKPKKSLESSLFWEKWFEDRRPTLFEAVDINHHE